MVCPGQGISNMIRINDIIDKISEYNPEADIDLLDRAYIFSAKVHDVKHACLESPICPTRLRSPGSW